ncbi:putative MFS family arabinose efflux permease [Pseudomonas duriflava]|uniref:Putative MFS family arabinose efflux permease n=1 Tax=Pseudomonas duriflava TaxID=459528 RepID=A0A562QP87_9PSED|nr:YbfB/YjiJ family MFS transporter [Pseudomonas duriflava]TWI58569.1 putative MFS family arabinose efflux permease [Pseudomonas duriflava]
MTTTHRLFACLIALAVAMGIGRFALTPQLPHLLAEGQVDLTAAGLLAAANYLGYLVGALDAFFARRPRGRLIGGLWLCVGLTLLSVWATGFWTHAVLRFGAGLASAWVLVMVTGLSQPLAVQAGRPRLGALVFAGPGVGIVMSGLVALAVNRIGGSSALLWLIYAAVALVLVVVTLPALPSAPTSTVAVPSGRLSPRLYRLAIAYALVGMGYIVPATFLSQMATERFQGEWIADLFWPAFGLAAALGVVIVSFRQQRPGATRRWLIATLWLQATGVLLCLLPGVSALLLGVLLCGGPFLASMQLVMQHSRELAPDSPHRNAGLLTAAFATGQLLGPLLAAISSHYSNGLSPALWSAGAGLVVAGGLLLQPSHQPLPKPATGRR